MYNYYILDWKDRSEFIRSQYKRPRLVRYILWAREGLRRDHQTRQIEHYSPALKNWGPLFDGDGIQRAGKFVLTRTVKEHISLMNVYED